MGLFPMARIFLACKIEEALFHHDKIMFAAVVAITVVINGKKHHARS